MGRSPGEGNGYPPQYSYLENSLARGAWWGTIHGVAKSWTQLSHQLFHIKDELFVVNSGDSGMRQGETLSWRRGSLCPGWLQECPPALCAHPSCLRSSCPTEPAPTQCVSGQDAELDAGPQREALLCTGSYYGLCCWVFADTDWSGHIQEKE